MSYPFKKIEAAWQKKWEEDGIYHAKDGSRKEKFYGLIEFPFLSGEGLHVGHPRSYTGIDIVTRKKRMEGKNVLYPIGWDAFGLPTENFAIKHKVKPHEATAKNIASFKRQLTSLGFGFDWSREVSTADPKYYKWTQWMFLQFFNATVDAKTGRARPAKGDEPRMAYKATTTINWCPNCKIGLANEEAQGGVCERCGGPVEKREKQQWMIRISAYADRLIQDLDTVDYIDRVRTQQINWIGRSEGAYVTFPLAGISGQDDGKHTVKVFTTRPDTMFGATFLAISPELAKTWLDVGWQASNAVKKYVKEAIAARTREEEKEKRGIDTGIHAINPATGEKIPVWIASYVLGDVGTGAIMAVPAHDERDWDFAIRHQINLPPRVVVSPMHPPSTKMTFEGAFTDDGYAVCSDFLNGLATQEAKEKMIAWLEKEKKGERAVTYKLRDWVFSRQRYWGEPIPIILCETCGHVPVPEKELPLKLPDVDAYEPTDTGESPLAKIEEWVNVTCPSCKGPAKRETDTMPNWAGSSWYFLRYIDPHNDKAFADPKKLKYWMPVDLYNGGMEHTTLHLLYSRFWYKFLWDLKLIPEECGSEPYARRRSHALILGEGGVKMSKSKGNVVNPDDVVEKYGADVFRMYEMFIGPFDADAPWDTSGIEGIRRFLEKVWKLFGEKADGDAPGMLLHQTIKKVGDDIETLNFNTAVSSLMILANAMKGPSETFLKLLAPFAPHLAEELWEKFGHTTSIHLEPWPTYDPKKLVADTFELVVQVNGKVRDRITAGSDISDEDACAAALQSEKVQAFLEGKKPKKVMYVKGRLVSIYA